MTRKLDTKEYLDEVSALLAQGHADVPVPVAGGSMAPFLHHGDTVYLQLPKALKRGDVVLYLRPGGQYVLHRILRLCPDGSVLVAGDAQQEPERIRRDWIRGRASAARHGGKLLTEDGFRWRFYAGLWLALRPRRRALMKIAHTYGKNRL